MTRIRCISLLLAVACATAVLAPSASSAVPSAPSAGDATAPGGCDAAEQRLSSASGVAIEVCPALPRSVGEAVRVPAPSAGPCTATMVDKCEAWVSDPYDGPAAGNERVGDLFGLNANSAATSPDGSKVFTAGPSEVGNQQEDAVTIAYDATNGNQLWNARWESPDERPRASVTSVQAGPSAVYVSGYSFPTDAPGTGFTLAYDAATGAKLWEAETPGLANSSAMGEDGKRLFVVTEGLNEEVTRVDAELIAYNAATGSIEWTRRLVDAEDRHLVAWRVAAAGDRVTFAASRLNTYEGSFGATRDLVIATYDASGPDEGALISRVQVPSAGVLPAGIALNADGSRAFVTHANAETGSNLQSAKTIAVNTTGGAVLWTARFDGLVPQMPGYALPWYFQPIDVSPNGDSVYLAVFVNDAFGWGGGFVTLAYNGNTGAQKWATKMGAASNLCWGPCGPSISVNPKSGEVVVAGNTLAVNRTKPTTWAYDSAGTLRWMRMSTGLPAGATVQVGHSSIGQWSSIVHSPDGARVFVAGNVFALIVDSASSPDIVVAAFSSGT